VGVSDKIDLTDASEDAYRLLTLETEIIDDLKAVFRIGMNLLEIRDDKLWQGNYKSFEDYCTERWQKGSNWARKMIKAVEVKEVVPIENEWQARQLSDLSDEDKVEVFSRAVDEVNDPTLVTGSQLKRIKNNLIAEHVHDGPDVGAHEKQESEDGFRKLHDDFEHCLNNLKRIGAVIEGIASQDDGAWLDMDEFRIDLNNLKSNLKMARPHSLCPYCSGSGKIGDEKCTACLGLGWVPKSVFEEAPDQYKTGGGPQSWRDSMGAGSTDTEVFVQEDASALDPVEDDGWVDEQPDY
jgi:hypothetical protein